MLSPQVTWFWQTSVITQSQQLSNEPVVLEGPNTCFRVPCQLEKGQDAFLAEAL